MKWKITPSRCTQDLGLGASRIALYNKMNKGLPTPSEPEFNYQEAAGVLVCADSQVSDSRNSFIFTPIIFRV